MEVSFMARLLLILMVLVLMILPQVVVAEVSVTSKLSSELNKLKSLDKELSDDLSGVELENMLKDVEKTLTEAQKMAAAATEVAKSGLDSSDKFNKRWNILNNNNQKFMKMDFNFDSGKEGIEEARAAIKRAKKLMAQSSYMIKGIENADKMFQKAMTAVDKMVQNADSMGKRAEEFAARTEKVGDNPEDAMKLANDALNMAGGMLKDANKLSEDASKMGEELSNMGESMKDMGVDLDNLGVDMGD
jgi:DNA repair ATPase RecN